VLIVVPTHGRERMVVAAFADALARFRRADKLADLSFCVASEETLGQRVCSVACGPGCPSSTAA
jgi:hypothetical protein